MNSSTTLPSLKAFTAGIDWIPERLGQARIRVGVDLDELDLAVALATAFSITGLERAAGTAPLGPEVDDHGLLEGALDDCRARRFFSGVDGHPARIDGMRFPDRCGRCGPLPARRSGRGPPVVLLHGLDGDAALRGDGLAARSSAPATASIAVRRARPRAVRPGPRPEGLRLRAPGRRTSRRSSTTAASTTAPLARRARWAPHTLMTSSRSSIPTASPASVIQRPPPTTPEDGRARPMDRWDRLVRRPAQRRRRGLRRAPTARRTCRRSGWRRSTASCISASPPTTHPDALADAHQRRPALAAPSSTGATCRRSSATVIVASRDEVDLEHPYATGERYARRRDPDAHAGLRGGRRLTARVAGRPGVQGDQRGGDGCGNRAMSSSAHSTTSLAVVGRR